MGIEFSELIIKNYRRLRHIDMELRPFNVLIGGNGSGKTSLLEVMEQLASSAQGNLHDTLSAGGGLNSLLTYDSGSEMEFHVLRPIDAEVPLEYSLTLRTSGMGYEIARESLVQYHRGPSTGPFKHFEANGSNVRYFNPDRNVLESPTWDHQSQETALSQVPKLFRSP